ncbi:glycosyltransferase family 4 protein [Cupriavidus basilensis]|uniref:Glycosyltransferase family 4 protein n=1 Tax=Cupriavidus basilensis TaxID=68895 RepID=A0ABT6AZL5_9BURK|nr:glycosyltransferase family 4 protein [Cupriavidus basilensis]MDF3838064.1 glycosyltransferase family 4 protein [Cupriavidus basilensis]
MTAAWPRLCFLTGTLNAVAGAERMTATMANALAGQGYAVTILSLWDAASCFPLHPAVRHEALFASRPSFKRAYAGTVAGIRRHLRANRTDVLVQVDPMLAFFALPAALGLGVRHLAWEHCHFDEDLGKPARRLARRLAARFCEAVVVLTERDRRRWLEALRPRSAVVCIPNPLPFAVPAQAAPRTDRTVLAVGRLVAAKGFDVLLRAWAEVVPQAPGWRLTIAGEGEERATLEALRDELGLSDSVTLPGIYEDVTIAYKLASVFCLSSRYEGFGLVLLEAMAFGLPIVSTDCETGPRELLEPGRDALMVPVDQPAALAQALGRLIRHPGEAAALGEAAREKARTYAQEQIVGQWETLIARGKNPSGER